MPNNAQPMPYHLCLMQVSVAVGSSSQNKAGKPWKAGPASVRRRRRRVPSARRPWLWDHPGSGPQGHQTSGICKALVLFAWGFSEHLQVRKVFDVEDVPYAAAVFGSPVWCCRPGAPCLQLRWRCGTLLFLPGSRLRAPPPRLCLEALLHVSFGGWSPSTCIAMFSRI